MLTHRGFSAWIVADSKILPEYLPATDTEENRVSCWIPSEEGQKFSVYWQDHGGKVDSCSFITLDGFVVPGRFLFGEGVASREGVRTSKTTERPFMFQKIPEEEIVGPELQSSEVGMITLRIKRITRVASRLPNTIRSNVPSVLGKRKAGEICVGFGEEKPTYEQYTSTWAVKPYDGDTRSKKPSTYVSFVFRYRSRPFLVSQGIVTEARKPRISTGAVPTNRKPSAPRRVASVPNSTLPALVTPSPSPPKKAKLELMPIYRVHPDYQRRRPSADLRRISSWHNIPSNTSITPNPAATTILTPIPVPLPKTPNPFSGTHFGTPSDLEYRPRAYTSDEIFFEDLFSIPYDQSQENESPISSTSTFSNGSSGMVLASAAGKASISSTPTATNSPTQAAEVEENKDNQDE